VHPDYVGFRIWYGDGSVKSSADGEWADLPSEGVQFVTFYLADTYQIFIDGEWRTENYVEQFHGADYYWLNAGGRPGAGSAANASALILAEGALKTGSWMFEETGTAYWDLAAEAQTVRTAP
jgi:hypothetical protein